MWWSLIPSGWRPDRSAPWRICQEEPPACSPTPTGFEHVMVNGVALVAGGQFTGATPGRLLRSGRDTETVTVPGAAGQG